MADDARFWDKIARKYAADPIEDLAGYERAIERVRALIKPGDAVLEAGCGTGTTALKLAASAGRYVASDISSEMIAIAREKAAADGAGDVTFEVATLEAAPWPDGSFDAVLAFNLLHLVRDRGAALRAAHRLLKPGGLFVSKTPCLGEMNFAIKLLLPLMQAIGRAPHVAVFSGPDLEREIAAAGFEIIERARHGSRGKDTRPFFVARRV